MSELVVRRLARGELAAAPAVLAPEGWIFSVDELDRLRRLGGAVGALLDGEIVGFLTFVDLPPVRWIGNVVVRPAARGRGLGARLVEAAAEGAPVVGLYAVEKAITLYGRLGFVAHGDAWALHADTAAPRTGAPAARMRAQDLPDVEAFDRAHAGMDRSALLRAIHDAHPDHGRIVREGGRVRGYGFAKVSPEATELGPLVAIDAPTASAILDDLLRSTPGPHDAAALGANQAALGAFAARGFLRSFRTVAMFRGAEPSWRPTALFAAAGLEKG